MFPLAKEQRGRRQGSTSKELTLELILFLGPLVPFLLVNETLFHRSLMDVSFKRGRRQGRTSNQLTLELILFSWSPGSSSPGE